MALLNSTCTTHLLDLDFNVLLYEVVVAHLDDASWISFGSSCKLLYNKLVNNPNIWEEKLKFLDQQFDKTLKEEEYLDHFKGQEQRIADNFLHGYYQFRHNMFTRLDSNNCLNDGGNDLEPLMRAWKKTMTSEGQQKEDTRASTMKIQYLLFKKYMFCNIVSNGGSDNAPNVCRHLNHSVMATYNGFWRSYFVNNQLKPQQTYCWSILLTQFDRSSSNSWTILVGVNFNDIQGTPEPLTTWLSFGYCVKSNAIVKQSYTSYDLSNVNQEGHLIGIKCNYRRGHVDFHVYLANGTIHRFESNESTKGICRPIVSLVNGKHMVTVLPWDGNVSSLQLSSSDTDPPSGGSSEEKKCLNM
ncbi:hypothetical protein C9374_010604 [Naegleria lovaniensis]|uniref:Uncharacterized protein n=1 Tax=Naegleria lovaniensis TaxID=51637 RepID=A0AA88KDC4_NAELO|nr:uncharacterized protein C9374_010604 [Naegleria lovaniensis]KAG2374585.1 hypothetical protein C9374_010604 [Naegleria lovaniensis]